LNVIYMVVSINGEDVCELCPVNNYCTNRSIYACPENHVSLLGSEFLINCTSEPNWETSTALFTTTTTPEPSGMSTISFTTSLVMSLVEFDSTKRDEYRTGIAQALSIPVSSVTIGDVTETVVRRRLLSIGRRILTTSIEVETIATVPSEDADSVSAAVTNEDINGALASSGMAIESVTPPAVQEGVTTPPIAIGILHEWVPLAC